MQFLSPFLWMGTIFAVFHSVGIEPVRKEMLKMITRGEDIE